jgi:hypothetical protein
VLTRGAPERSTAVTTATSRPHVVACTFTVAIPGYSRPTCIDAAGRALEGSSLEPIVTLHGNDQDVVPFLPQGGIRRLWPQGDLRRHWGTAGFKIAGASASPARRSTEFTVRLPLAAQIPLTIAPLLPEMARAQYQT